MLDNFVKLETEAEAEAEEGKVNLPSTDFNDFMN